MEKRRPWEPSKEALELEFQRKTLADLRSNLRDFAQRNDITYDLDKDHDSISVFVEHGDADKFNNHILETLETLNEMLKYHGKEYLFVAHEYKGGLKINAISAG